MNAVRFSLVLLLLSLPFSAAADEPILGVAVGDDDATHEIPAADARAGGISGHGLTLFSCTEIEPNERTTNASPIDVPGICSGTVSVGDPFFLSIVYSSGNDGVEDFFKFVLPSPTQIKLTMSYTAGNLDLFVFNATSFNPIYFDNSTTGNPETITTGTLAAGTYYIGVSARSGSASYSVAIDVLGVATPPPAAPSNLVATAIDADTIRLTWNDNSSNETSFLVQQLTGGGTFTDLPPLLAANTTTLDVNGLAAGTTATFRGSARNAGGDSAYSNQASATTTGGFGCVTNATTACLLNNRFRVTINYVNPFSTPPNQPGTFLTTRLTPGPGVNPDVALFGFLSADAVEVIVRLWDARPYAPRFDVFIGGLTDVEYTVAIRDMLSGRERTYVNQVGQVGGKVDRVSFPAP